MALIRHLRRAALLQDGGGLSDGQLLECYLARREEAAFEALVRRHGPMVLGVCRRVLRDEHEAEDAFQATFLVLHRKASSILPRDRVGNWLYGVAHRTALKAKTLRAKRRTKERLATRPEPSALGLERLDEVLSRLPAKYREPIVLCYLQEKTRREAARILGWPEGTVATRLAMGRRMLARRLDPELLVPSVAVPHVLVASTVRSAFTAPLGISTSIGLLTGAVLRGMVMSKIRVGIVAAIALSALGMGLGAGSYHLLAGQDVPVKPSEPAVARSEVNTEERAEGRLPIGPPPHQVLASLTDDGRLAIKTVTARVRTFQQPTADGQLITAYERKTILATSHYRLADIEVQDSRGNKIVKEQLPQLLKAEVPALTYSERERLDPLHLRLIKDGTLVFLLPHSDATPVPFGVQFYGPDATPVPVQIYGPPPPVAPRDEAPMTNHPSGTRIGEIRIVGNEKTADDVILRAIKLSPGQSLAASDLKKAEERLKRLNRFERASVTILDGPGDFKDILVTVQEK